MSEWQLGSFAGLDDRALAEAVVARFQAIRDDNFTDNPDINPTLGIEVRALRRLDGWRIFLILTPWMLARIFLAERDPGMTIAREWQAAARTDAPYVVIGPALKLTLVGGDQLAHLNYDRSLGHYLVQPLVQTMDKFTSADAVFQAWNEVIATRQRVMEEQQRDCPWQRELSRREFFTRFPGRKA
ncbi:MAG: hypothetical protein AUJ86_05200 [Hydrogenophilaceae bacterium CG1_02_62_390]|nr:[NiFe]-hydrogenase assembly chaperone HybE [Betaproteobacteria bacterium]OIO78525.1 MAG: hypothetical protein AUJ86_05200 [Hydrogenophilaceae bacterium CG1_02_62_390]PIX02698.1 MAG: DUF3457 domain-containing protein [Hydrogenophilales bacterium CG_4_8_14_3_um_filter_62_83]